jgi:hypothetical protein
VKFVNKFKHFGRQQRSGGLVGRWRRVWNLWELSPFQKESRSLIKTSENRVFSVWKAKHWKWKRKKRRDRDENCQGGEIIERYAQFEENHLSKLRVEQLLPVESPEDVQKAALAA